ncbi:hypothetical protein A1Q1_02041 [Trichosporon asahii var. asahii CBS 2479]|uniref:Uncharacterized protein n=1 Tax=Trichosporon asahii var. asahii (strain ATCC 90039 / CBS 2479 / JCM 2466 / KCTC 7840 / NBRC 103889/ NCYC 2677 / UAMH 7654) TaxID=1186058 RepID=J6F137_TRIAS|nr:hypothetical protein A1Q1_02041 [Trichosporon asahii var. asahii CBS 2479]EJT48872.1 hypothetical protein A1Q1_02041 [Trichosporon asahii var. asahii CBS 2479]
MKLATTLAVIAATLPAVFGQGFSLDRPADNATVEAGDTITLSWTAWGGDQGQPPPSEAYFWISAFNVAGQNAWSISPDGKTHRVDDSQEALATVKPIDVSEGSLAVHIDYTDFLAGRADKKLPVRIMITQGNMRDVSHVGTKGQVYVNRNIMLEGLSPGETGVNASLTTTAESLLPVQTDDSGAKYQHVKGAEGHVNGTVDAKSSATRSAAVIGPLALVAGVIAAALVA